MQSHLVCNACGNRSFANREALAQHLKTSSQWHPNCAKCEKRFISSVAYDAHMGAKHPPRFECKHCGRDFGEPFQLEDHFRGSPVHPNCPRCGKGFLDDAALSEHRVSAHVKVQCELCHETVYAEDLEIHYTKSNKHPNCPTCEVGCKDKAALEEHKHTHTIDSEPSVSEERPRNPDSSSSDGNPQTAAKTTGLSSDQSSDMTPPSASFPLLEAASPVKANAPTLHEGQQQINAAATSQRSPPHVSSWPSPAPAVLQAKPFGPLFNPSIRKDLLAQSSLRTDTPPLQLSMAYASPLMQVVQPPDLYTPVNGLAPPSPEMNRAWSAKANRLTANATLVPFTKRAAPLAMTALTKSAAPASKLAWRKPGPASTLQQSPTETFAAWSSPQNSSDAHFRSCDSFVSSWANSRLHSASRQQPIDVISTRALRSPESCSLTGLDGLSSLPPLGKDTRGPCVETIDDLHSVQPPTLKSPADEADDPLGEGIPASATTASESSTSMGGHEAARTDSPPTTTSPSVASLPTAVSSPLHCRQCKADSCEDITATMCGHIFCYRCITSAVIASSKCPVCSTPTLLYCLFRLDLAS